MAAEPLEGRQRHRWLLSLGALVGVAVIVCGVLVWKWFTANPAAEQAQITGFSRQGSTSLLVEYVRGDHQRVLEAYADETSAAVTLHVVLSSDSYQGAGTHPALIYSTLIALNSPADGRAVIDSRGQAVAEQPPGVIQAPRDPH